MDKSPKHYGEPKKWDTLWFHFYETIEKTNLIWAQGEEDLPEKEMGYFMLIDIFYIFVGVVITVLYISPTYQIVHLK